MQGVLENVRREVACGSGAVVLERIAGKTAVSRVRAASPLRILTPANSGKAAWVFTSTFGGGLVAGDQIALEVGVGAGAMGFVGTQSATKVYRGADAAVSQQTASVRVAGEGLLVWAPDPVVCFAGARYAQRQRFDVAASGGLILVDAFTSGRHACGERWQARELRSSNELFVEGECLLRDVMLLEGAGFGMEAFNCFATIILAGQRLAGHAAELLAWTAAQPVSRGDRLPIGASPLRQGGAIFRAAGPDAQTVMRLIFDRLQFVEELLGECPWRRKW